MRSNIEIMKTLIQITLCVCICMTAVQCGKPVRASIMHCIAIAATMHIYADFLKEYIGSKK